MSNADRVAQYRQRQKKLDRSARVLYLTEDEAFYLKRVLAQMRKENSKPAMMRRANGTMSTLDV